MLRAVSGLADDLLRYRETHQWRVTVKEILSGQAA